MTKLDFINPVPRDVIDTASKFLGAAGTVYPNALLAVYFIQETTGKTRIEIWDMRPDNEKQLSTVHTE